jgi:hypothetical protein
MVAGYWDDGAVRMMVIVVNGDAGKVRDMEPILVMVAMGMVAMLTVVT